MKSLLTVLLLACAAVGSALSVPASKPLSGSESEGERLFRERVLPLLESSCFECHGPDERRVKGGLRMTGQASLLKGGNTGPALDLEEPGRSLILELVAEEDPEFRMPPDEPLAPEAIADLQRWVELGAPWPEAESESEELSPELAAFFEDEVRPVLAARCFPCHGPEIDDPRSGLRMTGRDALLKGSRFGPSIVPGDPDASRLIRAVRYRESSLKMPPPGPLPAKEVAILERWVAVGAPWPGGLRLDDVGSSAHGGFDVAAAREQWPYRPLTRPQVPQVDGAQHSSPIDAFVAERLVEAGLQPNARATDRELIRRAYFDLIGLPPTYEIVEYYAALEDPDKWERLIDHLLDKPAYGERWGRQWLDLVRFAQSDGYEEDAEKAYAWRYRDYVIKAFNEDLPYDRFLAQQIAGDELEPDNTDALIATGIYHVGPYEEGVEIAEQVRVDGYDDVLRVFTEGFMGMTIGCARCHDHEYDPVTQDDYYGLSAFISNMQPYALPVFSLDSSTLSPIDFDAAARLQWEAERLEYVRQKTAAADAVIKEQRRRLLEELVSERPEDVQLAYLTPAAKRTPEQREQIKQLHKELPPRRKIIKSLPMHDSVRFQTLREHARRADSEETFEGSLDWVLHVKEFGPAPGPTHVLALGKSNSPLHVVEPHFPPVFVASESDSRPQLPEQSDDSATSGRRSVLANWIASADNPLTARVMANRVWQGHFGDGIVSTVNDFGASGVPPTHPELLDWLATEFVESGWSVKQLHRTIMLSEAYQRSSSISNADAAAFDAENDLLWRQNLRRLDAEILRDTLLAVSGELNQSPGGRGFFPELSRETLGGGSKPGDGWGNSSADERARRAVYAFVKRGMLEPLSSAFDCANPVLPVGKRAETTTANQSLMLLNSDFVNLRAAELADRVRAYVAGREDDDDARIERLFQLVLSRDPSQAELELCRDYLRTQASAFDDSETWIALDPQVPDRLQDDYFFELAPEEILYGPREGWTYLSGSWGNGYNNTREVDLERGPAALSEVSFSEGRVTAEVRLADGCRFGSVLLRADELRANFTGLEVRLDHEAGALRVLQHGPFGSLAATELADVPFEFEYGRSYALAIDLNADRLEVGLDGAVALGVDVANNTGPGRLGLRCWGDTFEVRELQVHATEGTVKLEPEGSSTSRERAFDSLCLAALNFNEFLYVD
jgi:uncharacterized protein DUF1553/uncharacterized protein DUF1549/cytochrome c